MKWTLKWVVGSIVALFVATGASAGAAEICGNGIDDAPQNGLVDEGCYPSLRAGVCESPLSCMDTGWVSWSTGSLHYDVPADVAPKSPYGPAIGFRRFYTSLYAPPPATPGGVNRTPLGARWQHNYMSWIDQSPESTTRVLHTAQGEDVFAFPFVDPTGDNTTWQFYRLQDGHHVQSFRQRRAAPREYELHMLTGETLIYDSLGQLTEVWGRVALTNTNKVRIAWTTTSGGRAVSTVTDATGLRRLRLGYTGAVLTSVDFQLRNGGTWTTHHTTLYEYAGGTLASVKIGGQWAQFNTYSGGYLTQIRDGNSRPLATFQYTAARPGETVSIETPDGTLGFEYNATPQRCQLNEPPGAGKTLTVLYFNKGNATACSADADCGAGFLCGGQTSTTGATGACFRAARCLTVDSSSRESLVTDVKPLGPPGEACTGACAKVMEYIWSPALDLQATRDARGKHVSIRYNDDGLPTKMVLADPDRDPNNPGGARTTWFFYDPVEKGRVVEIRRQSVVPGLWECTDSPSSWPCAKTRLEVEDGEYLRIERTIESGFTTLDGIEAIPFEHTTTRMYNALDQLVQIDGPLTDVNDVTEFYYFASADPLTYGFLRERREHPNESQLLVRKVAQYDFWGNATDWTEPDGTRSCRSYDPARNVIVKTSEEMNDVNSGCATDDPSDLIERYTWDSNLRLLKTIRPDGSCMLYGYDSKGRLSRTMRRDDCNPESPGPREDYEFNPDGQVTAIYTYDAAGNITRKQLQSYYDSRQLQAMINPVDTSKLTALTYDARGSLTEIAQPGNLGRTTLTVDDAYQVTGIDRASIVNPWVLTYDAQGQPRQVTDPDLLKIKTTYDDTGRIVIRDVPGVHGVRIRYNANGEPISVIGGSTIEYTRDTLGRVLSADLGFVCPPPRRITVQAAYDSIAPLACPIADGCKNITGRLAYVRVPLICSSLFPDGTLDQVTFYSYDAAGRVVAEHITYDTPVTEPPTPPRVFIQTYTWTKSGDLATATMPSTATIGFNYGSEASNADTDLVTAVWRTSPEPENRVIDSITWKPYGPVEQYNRRDTIGGSPLRMKMTYNAAYRTTGIRLDAQNGSGPYYQLAITEDAKGRVTGRDFDPGRPEIPGVFDSFYKYDDVDRLVCESTVPVTSCPGSGPTLKNHMVGGFTGAGDRSTLLRPNPGAGTGNTNRFDSGSHRVMSVTQSGGTEPAATTTYSYSGGVRFADDNLSSANPNDRRTYTYDWRKNLVGVQGWYWAGDAWHQYYVASGFDARNRRVFKAFEDATAPQHQKQWFFFYDGVDRLSEVRYIPNAAVPTTYFTYQLFWLENTLVAYWRTGWPGGETTKRYVEPDETGRPVRMHEWLPPGVDGTVAWAINPDAWGMDKVVAGPDEYQPIVFAGQYRDPETAAYLEDGVTVYRPGLVLNGHRTYDPFTGAYLQLDPAITDTWSAYAYADNNPVGLSDPDGLRTVQGTCWVWSSEANGWAPTRCPKSVPDSDHLTEPSLAGLFDGIYWREGGKGDPTDRKGKQESRDKPDKEDKDEEKKDDCYNQPDLMNDTDRAFSRAVEWAFPRVVKWGVTDLFGKEGYEKAEKAYKLLPQFVKDDIEKPVPWLYVAAVQTCLAAKR